METVETARLRLRPWTRDDLDVWIPPAGVVPDGFVYIPGGRYPIGGDKLAGGEPRRIVALEPFAIGRYPVTMAEYALFLNALADDDPVRAAARAPRIGGKVYWAPEPDGVYRAPWTDPDGDACGADFPVFMVPAGDGDAYCEWLSRRLGLPVRLPSSDEWEAAARGADDRVHPWGDGFDPSLCLMRDTRARVYPAPVSVCPTDLSPFGIRGLAGLVREWTSTTAREGRFARGGSWQAFALQCRIGARAVVSRGVAVGLRPLVEVRS